MFNTIVCDGRIPKLIILSDSSLFFGMSMNRFVKKIFKLNVDTHRVLILPNNIHPFFEAPFAFMYSINIVMKSAERSPY